MALDVSDDLACRYTGMRDSSLAVIAFMHGDVGGAMLAYTVASDSDATLSNVRGTSAFCAVAGDAHETTSASDAKDVRCLMWLGAGSHGNGSVASSTS